MKLSLKLINSNIDIEKKILVALLPECSSFLNKAMSIIKIGLPSILDTAIKNTPEYSSLISGQLRLELGIPNANDKILQIIDIWLSNIIYNFQQPTISSNKIKGSIEISIIKSDYSDVLGSSAAYVSDNIRNYDLPWLQWLLLEGRKIIVPKHEVVLGPNPRSRTGFAIMSPSRRSWKIPPEFAGTENNNWITRALDSTEQDINTLLEKALS